MSEPEIIHVGRRDCPTCGQIEVADSSGNILDHNQPDGRGCSVGDIDWNGALTLHPVSPVERRSYVSTERLAAAERECDQLRAERDRLREVVLAIRDSGVAHPLILEAIGTASGLLDGEGQQR